jgi:hypothetical protein
MVRGLALFTNYFQRYANRYVLIGGTACTVLMEEAGLEFRATRDLDIVLCIEALDGEFVRAFWEFIRLGRYRHRQKSTGQRLLYRFIDPEEVSYPTMMELFARTPDALTLPDDNHITSIPIAEEVSSLSAILLDTDYYHLIHAGKRIINGIPVVTPEFLIPLKARAWLDLTALRNTGVRIQSGDISKHRNDVFRLYQLLTRATRIALPATVRQDLWRFLQLIGDERVIDLKKFGLHNSNLEEVCATLRMIYGL